MLARSLASSYIGLIIGNIVGLVKEIINPKTVIWKGEYYYKQATKSSIWLLLGIGLSFTLISLPWFTFIPYNLYARILASTFLAIGYFSIISFPTNFTRIYLFNDSIEVKIGKFVVATIYLSDIITIIRETEIPYSYDLLYRSNNKYALLSSVVYKFSLPLDLMATKWGIKTIEISGLNKAWDENTNTPFIYKLIARSLLIINPLTALMAYIIIYGPFSNYFIGLLIMELVSVYYTYINGFLLRNFRQKPNDKILSSY